MGIGDKIIETLAGVEDKRVRVLYCGNEHNGEFGFLDLSRALISTRDNPPTLWFAGRQIKMIECKVCKQMTPWLELEGLTCPECRKKEVQS